MGYSTNIYGRHLSGNSFKAVKSEEGQEKGEVHVLYIVLVLLILSRGLFVSEETFSDCLMGTEYPVTPMSQTFHTSLTPSNFNHWRNMYVVHTDNFVIFARRPDFAIFV
jgi:hypothetical protein